MLTFEELTEKRYHSNLITFANEYQLIDTPIRFNHLDRNFLEIGHQYSGTIKHIIDTGSGDLLLGILVTHRQGSPIDKKIVYTPLSRIRFEIHKEDLEDA